MTKIGDEEISHDYAETIAIPDNGLYTFLGVGQHGKIHYFQPREDEIHVPLFEERMEHDLDLHLSGDPLQDFHQYVEDTTWQVLEEPDYQSIAEEYGFDFDDLDLDDVEVEDGQSQFEDW